MTLQLARDLGVPRSGHSGLFRLIRVVELDIAKWEEFDPELRGFWCSASVVLNGATTIEVDGNVGGFSTAGEFFNREPDT